MIPFLSAWRRRRWLKQLNEAEDRLAEWTKRAGKLGVDLVLSAARDQRGWKAPEDIVLACRGAEQEVLKHRTEVIRLRRSLGWL